MHLIIGFILGNIISDPSQISFYILIGASVFPDLDLVYIVLGKLSYFKHHRKLTHSIIGIIMFSSIIAFFFKNHEQAFMLSMLGMSIHVFFDLTNHFGTEVFYPFIKKRYAWEFTNVVEAPLYFTYIVIGSLLIFFDMKSVSILAGIITAFYLLMKGVLHHIALNYARLRFGKSKALPHFWNIFRWHTIHEEGNKYVLSDLDLISGKIKRAKSFEKAPESLRNIDKKISSFFDFAKYPIIEDGKNKGEIRLKDLRFFAADHFMIILTTDSQGKLTEKFKG